MIELKEFTKTFGDFTALERVTFQVEEGSIFGLVGSNGAGKSTLLRGLAGVYAPDGGQVLIDGEEPFENVGLKGKLFFVSDYPYFMTQFSLKDMADFYRRTYPNWDPSEYIRLRDLFRLDEKMKLHNMSKGMQRQSAIICALATRPDYLLMDEVFDGLDPVMRQLLKRVVSEQTAERKMTVMIASHNLRELEDFCDHVGLIHKGGVLFERELDELKLGIHKVQAIYRPALDSETLEELQEKLRIVKLETRGSLVSFVAKGSEEEIAAVVNSRNAIFFETLPLSLEEVFIMEMEAAGYDIDRILS
jgi:ABC-2 type transport system ATP-binding protein